MTDREKQLLLNTDLFALMQRTKLSLLRATPVRQMGIIREWDRVFPTILSMWIEEREKIMMEKEGKRS